MATGLFLLVLSMTTIGIRGRSQTTLTRRGSYLGGTGNFNGMQISLRQQGVGRLSIMGKILST